MAESAEIAHPYRTLKMTVRVQLRSLAHPIINAHVPLKANMSETELARPIRSEIIPPITGPVAPADSASPPTVAAVMAA